MAVEITEQETENATAVMTEEPKAEVDAEEIAEPAFVSVQILEEPLTEILEPVPVEPVKNGKEKERKYPEEEYCKYDRKENDGENC